MTPERDGAVPAALALVAALAVVLPGTAIAAARPLIPRNHV